ncbi:amidohydrolase family protein [Natronorubrum tibetense]|nr:amidohydrolase family protein [Natronorubrum tibetense]
MPRSVDDLAPRDSEPGDSDAEDTQCAGVNPTRRRYLATAGVGLSIPTAGFVSSDADGSTSHSETDERERESVSDLPLFDAHTHITPAEARGRDPLSADQLVDWMDANGIDRAVVLPLGFPESFPVEIPTSWVLDELEAYPDRLVPFCSIDPREVDGEDAARDLLEHYISRGARGFGELKVEMDIDDERLESLYELCADYGLPIIFHTDQQSMTDEVGLPRLEDVLASYPDVNFVAHAHGWWAHIDSDVEPVDLGSIPEGSITSRGRIWDLLAEYDNIYGDISTLGGWNALTRDHEHGQALLESHHDQLVFGTDYLFPGQEIPHFDLFDQFDLGLDAWANIRYRNIEALLR